MAEKAIGLKIYGSPTTGVDRPYSAQEFEEIICEWHRVAPTKPIMFHAGPDNLADFIELVAHRHNHPLHICHVHDPVQITHIAAARRLGRSVSCGVCPHHLLMTSHDVTTRGWTARMQPPLAHQRDSEHLMHLLARGDIDVIETDHAPHLLEAKLEADITNPDGLHDSEHATCFGVPGVEFALPLLFYQVARDRLTYERLVDAISTRPAAIIGLQISDKTYARWRMELYRIDDEDAHVASGAGWTPYLGCLAIGKIEDVTIAGVQAVRSGVPIARCPRVLTTRNTVL